ncbi:MAG: metal-dependent hydrolase [Candidatus Hydrogenedentota bacterium]
MNPATHFLTGWAFSLPVPLERKDRALVVLASVAPDLDGLVLIGDFAQGRSLDSLELWSRYHHVLGHNIASAVAIAAVCAALGRRKLLVAGLSFVSVHLHFLEDIIGARGPDGINGRYRTCCRFLTRGNSRCLGSGNLTRGRISRSR